MSDEILEQPVTKGEIEAKELAVDNDDTENRLKELLLLIGDDSNQTPLLFCELQELHDGEWHEQARWVRFEEDVEGSGGRWSKPFVASLSVRALFQLRQAFSDGVILLDLEPRSFKELVGLIVDTLISQDKLENSSREILFETLMSKHVHQREIAQKVGLRRELSEIGKKLSFRKEDETRMTSLQVSSMPPSTNSDKIVFKPNEHFGKKLAPGTEASSTLVGAVDFLNHTISAFIRLSTGIVLDDLTEVAVPTRFIFIMLGPSIRAKDFYEIGRAMSTIMSDDIFRDVAYRSRDRKDILSGLDRFFDEGTFLPPGQWDPTIRIQPPKSVPTQEERKTNVLNPIAEVQQSRTADTDMKRLEGGLVMTAGGDSCQDDILDLARKQQETSDNGMDPELQRTGRIFGGLILDVKRKVPWYLSDFTDALNVQCLASIFFLFFACLSPTVTFGGLLGIATDNNMAAFESILAGAICGTTYHLFAGQPLTVISTTGPTLLFEKILFTFCKDYDFHYLTLRFWIGIWAAIVFMFVVAFDLSALVALITRFTEECFATLISVIFIVESFIAIYGIYLANPISNEANLAKNYSCRCDFVNKQLSDQFTADQEEPIGVVPLDLISSIQTTSIPGNFSLLEDCSIFDAKNCSLLSSCRKSGPGCDLNQPIPDVFFFSCLIFIGTCALSFALQTFRTSRFLPNKVRMCISDFAVSISIVIMVGIDFLFGLRTPKLLVPEEFAPTKSERAWVVQPFLNPLWTIAVAPLPAVLLAVLLFMDQQIPAVIVNRRENKLKKSKGYHLDLFVLTLQIVICATFGLPYFVAATLLTITHVNSLRKQSETSAPGEQPKFLGLIEQRVTGFLVFVLIGCAIPLRGILKFVPMPVLYGVFLFMGLSALQESQFYKRFLLFFMPAKYQPDAPYLRHMRTWRVHLFTVIQLTAFVFLWIIQDIKQISILFILMLIVMVAIRYLLNYVFTQDELRWIDDILPKNPLAVRHFENGGKNNEKSTMAASNQSKSRQRRPQGHADSHAENEPLRERPIEKALPPTGKVNESVA